MPKTHGLSDKQKAFVREYLVDLNATQAAIRAGYSRKTADRTGHENLKKPEIAAEIARQTAERMKRLDLDADDLLRRAATIVTTDPRELTGHHIGACRYCYGLDHDYQWKTKREWQAACEQAEARKKERPGCEGGFGYNITKRPHHDCPECNGLGVPYVRFADTRDLSPAAQVLFEGVKQTKEGLEIIQASKAEAFKVLAKAKGLMVDKHEVTGKNGQPIEHRVRAKVVLVPVKQPAETTVRPMPKDGEQ